MKLNQNMNVARTLRIGMAIQCLAMVCCMMVAEVALAQIVQLPTVGSFSLQTSVSVPDSGSAYMGGFNSGRSGSVSRGPWNTTARGSQQSSASASVHATIIDLNELDLMIRSQTGPKSTLPELVPKVTKSTDYSIKPKGSELKTAEYEYLLALSHKEVPANTQVNEDARYYLGLAANARQMAHWNAVELYYKLAWESLPEKRREIALTALADAKKKAEQAALDANKSKSASGRK
jgi:hypothetical protein